MSQKFLNPVVVNGQVSAEYIDLSTSTSHSVNAGEIAWNSVDGTFDIGLLNGVTLQAGQEMHFYGKATEAISNGNAVMFAGVQGDHILIAKADAVTINTNPEYFMGVATQDFSTNDFGYVTAFGNVRGIDTSTYSLGDILYYDSTSATDGLLTPIIPLAPKAKIIVAAVVKVHATQGILAVRPHTMPRLKDIQDINIDTASAGEILQLQSDGVWENKTLSEAGIQPTLTNPVTGTGTTNYVSKFTGTTSLGNSQIFDNGTNVGIGTTSPNRRLTVNGIVTASNESSTVGDGAFVATGGSPTIVQTLQRTSGGFAYSMFQGFANNTTTGLTSLLVDYGVLGNLNSGVTPPNIAYSYFSVGSSSAYNNTYMRLHNNAEKQITVDGRLSIGTTASTSGARLDVRAQGALSTDIAFRVRNSADSANLVTVQGNGNVGIGTSTPNSRLEVNGNMIVGTGNKSIGSWPFFISDSSNLGWKVADSSGAAKFELYVGNSGINQMRLLGGLSIVGFSQDLSLGTSAYLNTVNISNTNGNVGIGNTSPTQKLDVTGNIKISNNNSLMFRNAANNADISIIQLTSTNQLNLGTTSSSVPSVIALHTNSTERMRITSGGEILIGGTFNPYTASNRGNITLNGSSSNIITFTNNSLVRGYLYHDDNNFEILNNVSGGAIISYTQSSERMRITSGGNVGIGTSSPTAKLHVEGSFLSNSPNANFLVDSTNQIKASVTSTTHGTGAGFELIDNSAAFGFNPFGDFRGVRADYDNGVWFVNESGCKLGLQPVDNNLWSEGNIIQTTDVPSNTTTPAAWVKIYNNDNSSFYFMPVYQ